MTNGTVLETTYEFLSHQIGRSTVTVVQNRLKIVRLDNEYTVLLNTLTVKQLTISLYLISDSAMVNPLKHSGNHSLKLTRTESLKAPKHKNSFWR